MFLMVQNTIEARIACNGGHDLPILCKVFHGLSKKDEALLFAVQTGISTDLTAGERLRADIVAEDEDACAFVAATEATGATFALDWHPSRVEDLLHPLCLLYLQELWV